MFSLPIFVTPILDNDKPGCHCPSFTFRSIPVYTTTGPIIPIINTALHPQCLSSLTWIPRPHHEPLQPPPPGCANALPLAAPIPTPFSRPGPPASTGNPLDTTQAPTLHSDKKIPSLKSQNQVIPKHYISCGPPRANSKTELICKDFIQ